MKRVYLDHNATTPLRREAREAWLAAHDALGGNPSSVHSSGRRARQMLDEARARVAAALGASEDEIVFTSGATEANNLALLGRMRASGSGTALLTTAVEHSSVLGPARQLTREGHRLEIAPVDSTGTVDLAALFAAAQNCNPAVISVMAANNEVGTCMPLDELRAGLRARSVRATFHTDAAQALGRIPVRLTDWGADLASFSAHKVGGPTGVGVLFVRAGTRLAPLVFGGEQERGLRAGTEDVAGIWSACTAIELAVSEQVERAARLARLSTALWEELAATLPEISLLGLAIDHPRRLPGTLSLLAPGVDGRILVTRLDVAGLEVSAGSACASGSIEPSHVVRAMGRSDEEARAALRVSIGASSLLADVRQAVDILRRTLGCARASGASDTAS